MKEMYKAWEIKDCECKPTRFYSSHNYEGKLYLSKDDYSCCAKIKNVQIDINDFARTSKIEVLNIIEKFQKLKI